MNNQIAVYNEFRAQLATLAEHNASVVFDYEDTAGNKEARSHVYKLRQTRSAVEKARKTEKAASLEYGRAVDAQAKEITGQLDDMVEVHASPLREIEERQQAVVDELKEHIEIVTKCGLVRDDAGALWPSSVLLASQERVLAFDPDDGFGDLRGEAAAAKGVALAALIPAIAEAKEAEAEAARKADEARAEIERQQRERDERIAKEATERAHLEAEQKANAEKEAAERREAELIAAAERAQREAAEAKLQAERTAADTEARIKREQEVAAQQLADERARREKNRAHKGRVNRAARDALVAGGVSEDCAERVVKLIAQGNVPAMTIAY